MIAQKKIIETLKKELTYLKKYYRIKRLGIFGSYARNTQKNSDIDILTDFKKPIGLFKFMDLEDYLHRLLKVKIDLVSKKALKPHIGKHILKEAIYLNKKNS